MQYSRTLSEILPREVEVEIGQFGKKKGLLGGILERINLPDVTLKPHRDMTYLLLGTASILAVGAIIATRTYKGRNYGFSN